MLKKLEFSLSIFSERWIQFLSFQFSKCVVWKLVKMSFYGKNCCRYTWIFKQDVKKIAITGKSSRTNVLQQIPGTTMLSSEAKFNRAFPPYKFWSFREQKIHLLHQLHTYKKLWEDCNPAVSSRKRTRAPQKEQEPFSALQLLKKTFIRKATILRLLQQILHLLQKFERKPNFWHKRGLRKALF